jgi:hypothetical protein
VILAGLTASPAPRVHPDHRAQVDQLELPVILMTFSDLKSQ